MTRARRRVVLASIVACACLAASRASAHDRCVEVSDVVGEQRCSRYGDGWSIERRTPFTFRFGFRYADVGVGDLGFREQFKAKHRPPGYVGYRYDGSALGRASLGALGVDGGVGIFVVGQLYVGLDAGFGLGSASTSTFSTGAFTLSDARGVDVLVFHGGVPVGYRVPLGRASLRGEVLFGGAIVSLAQYSRAEGSLRHAWADAARGIVEPRVAADVWFTQHLSFGAYAGVNVFDLAGRAFGLTLTFHQRAFDGDMSVF